jgi:methyl-accepting chemotaxis protein
MAEEVADISQSTADEADAVAEAADEQLSAMNDATAEAGSLAEQAERLGALVRGFDVSGDETDPGAAPGPNVAVGDGGRPE